MAEAPDEDDSFLSTPDEEPPIFTIQGLEPVSRCISWLSDDRIIVDWGDYTMRIWNLTNNSQEGMPMVYQGILRSFISTKDGRIISLDREFTPKVWNADTQEPIEGPWTTEGSYGIVTCITLSESEELLAICHSEGIVIWDMVGTMRFKYFINPQGYNSANKACFSPDGKRLAVSCQPEVEVIVLHLASGEILFRSLDVGYKFAIHAIVWSSERIFCARSDKTIRCLDLSTGETIGERWVGDVVAYCLSRSVDGNFLAGGSLGGEVCLWNAKDRTIRGILKRDARVFAVAFSPSGKFIGCTGGGYVSIWRVPWWNNDDRQGLLELSAIPSGGPSNTIPHEADLDFLNTPAPRAHRLLQDHSRLNSPNDPPRLRHSVRVLSWRWWKNIPRFVHRRTTPISMGEALTRTYVASRGSSPSAHEMPRHTVVIEASLGSGESSEESSSDATTEPEASQVGCCGLLSRRQPGAATPRERRGVPAERPSSSSCPPVGVSTSASAPVSTRPAISDILELSAVVRSSDTA